MKIRLSDIDEEPCVKYYNYIVETYRADGEFDPIEVFENVPGGVESEEVNWLMRHCKRAHTARMLNYYKSLEPDCDNIVTLIRGCEFAQNPEMLELYKSLGPDACDVALLIRFCDYAKTPEMLEYWLTLNPGKADAVWFMRTCKFAEKNLQVTDSGDLTVVVKQTKE